MLDQFERMPGKWSLMPAEVIEKNLPVVRSQLTGGSNQLSQMIAAAISLKDLPIAYFSHQGHSEKFIQMGIGGGVLCAR